MSSLPVPETPVGVASEEGPSAAWLSPPRTPPPRISPPRISPPETASALHSCLMDEAYEEFCRLEEQGAAVDPDQFCERFPAVQSSLARLIQAHRFLVDHTELLPDGKEPSWPEVGTEWLGFHLLRELGRGAFARVYQAAEPALGNRVVALKVSPRGDREAATLGRLEHPGVAPVFSARQDEGTRLWAICMPYRGSATFLQLLDRVNSLRRENKKVQGHDVFLASDDPFDLADQPAPPHPALKGPFSEAVRWLAVRLAEALDFIHQKGICHHDLKPSNILLQPDGSPVLLDFNLSVDARQPGGVLGGTPAYMAPEQLEAMEGPAAAAPLDPRSDLFSFGVIFHEVLTGEHPFGPLPLKLSTKEVRALLLERQKRGVGSPRSLCSDAAEDLIGVVADCLAFDRDKRPPSAQEILRRLAPPPAALNPAPRTLGLLRRRPRTLIACTLLILGLVAALVLSGPSSEALLRRAEAAMADKNFPQALNHYNQVLRRDPNLVEARLRRGYLYLKLEDAHSANADFQEADRLRPTGQTRALMGFCFQKLKQSLAAQDCYEKAQAQGFRPAWVLNNHAAISMENTAKIDLALAALEEARRAQPGAQPIHYNLAIVYLQKALAEPDKAKNFFEKGIDHAQTALASGPKSTQLLLDSAQLRARAAARDPRWVQPALDHLEEALDLGLDPRGLHGNSFVALRAEPRFHALLTRGPSGKAATTSGRTMDPPGIE